MDNHTPLLASNEPDIEQDDDEPCSPTKTKSIRIELEQQPGASRKGMKRRDSYKVKITTYREYEIDEPDALFKSGEDSVIFDYLARKAQAEEA